MIVVTGAAGFIGSNLIKKLNAENFNNIVAVDKFDNPLKNQNIQDCTLQATIDREVFFQWAYKNAEAIEFVFHLGARTDTLETDESIFKELNINYSQSIWKLCAEEQIPLVYASSAATYGDGSLGFSVNLNTLDQLKPLNAYGWSKHEFDLWAISQDRQPFYWAGLKFFNVYGQNEGHKGRMASMVYQMEQQILNTGRVQLFKSYHFKYGHGEQKRDFIQVSEVCELMYEKMLRREDSGIFNVGTKKATSFNDMAYELFEKHNLKPQIEYIDMPDSIKDKYQYFTEAE